MTKWARPRGNNPHGREPPGAGRPGVLGLSSVTGTQLALKKDIKIQHHSLVSGPASGRWRLAIRLRQPGPGLGTLDKRDAPQLTVTPVRRAAPPPQPTPPARPGSRVQSRGRDGRGRAGPSPADSAGLRAQGWFGEGGGQRRRERSVDPGREGHGEGRGQGRRCSRYASTACSRGGGAEPRRRWGLHQRLHFSSRPQRHRPSPGLGAR